MPNESEREAFETFLFEWSGRNIDWHRSGGTWGVGGDSFAWACWQKSQAAERERCAKIVDVSPEAQAWEIHGGQETIDVLRDVAARIRAA